MLDLSLLLLLTVLGAISGLLAGLLGIGGGMVLVPVLTYVMHEQGVASTHIVHASIATSLAIILFNSLSSMRAHHRAGAVDWKIVQFVTPGLLLGGLLGSTGATYLPTTELALVFGVFVLFSAYQIYSDKKPKPSRLLPRAPGLIAAGVVIGAASSIVGAGGGFLSVPFMLWSNVPLRSAVATSAALGFPIALFSSFGYIFNGMHLSNMPPGFVGYISLPAVASVVVASVFTAPLGARLAHSLPIRPIKRLFALVLTCVAMSMIYKAATGF